MKTILVVGGTGGLGSAIVKHALQLGHNVVFTYSQNKDKAQQLQKQWASDFPTLQIEHHQLNLNQSEKFSDLVDFVSSRSLQAVIFASGVFREALIATQDESEARQIVESNFFGPYQLVQALLPVFMANKGGHFVFLSSIARHGQKGLGLYSASKGALTSFSQSLAVETGRKNISSVVLDLGVIATEEVLKANQTSFAEWKSRSPLNRLLRPEEIAYWALQFCRPEAIAANGATLLLSGGLTCLP